MRMRNRLHVKSLPAEYGRKVKKDKTEAAVLTGPENTFLGMWLSQFPLTQGSIF